MLLVAATTGYQTRSFTDAAKKLDIELILATDRCHVLENPWGDLAIPIRFEAPEEALTSLVKIQVNGVVAVGDRPAWIAALAAEQLGLPFHATAAVETASDKHLARERFRAAKMPVPDYYCIPIDEEPEDSRFYPCVLKPLGLSASRGVIRADTQGEFRSAFQRIRAILHLPEIRRLHETRDQFLQVERFIPGREFALEGLVTQGELRTLAIFDKPDPLDGPYFEETIYVTPSRESAAMQSEMVEATQRAITALGLHHGPVHAEMRINPEGIFMLEVAARPIGGLCSRALRFASGATLEELILRHAIGQEIGEEVQEPAAVMMIPIPRAGTYHGVEGIEEAHAVEGIVDIAMTAKIGQNLIPLPEGASYLGFIFASGSGAEKSVRNAHEKIKFSISSALPVIRDTKR